MQLKAQEETDHVLLNMTFTVSNIIEYSLLLVVQYNKIPGISLMMKITGEPVELDLLSPISLQ